MAIDEPHPRISEADADLRIASNRGDVYATLAKADHRILARDYRAAAAFYGAVGRLANGGAEIARDDLLRARDAAFWLDRRFAEHLAEGLDHAGLTVEERHPRFQKSLEIMLGMRPRDPVSERFPQLPLSYFYPDLAYCDFADSREFPFRDLLRERTEAVLSEAGSLIEAGGGLAPYLRQTSERPQGDVHGLLENSDWSTFDLTERGLLVAERVARCPVTCATLDADVPLCRISSRAPSLMFSLLRPGSKIPPHTGMLNVRFVCHLPLIVPLGCGFRVGDITRKWKFGELLVFDDTVEHEAWNNSRQDRLVLIFDIWRPELTLVEREQIQALFQIVDSY
ncbi:MAG: aspartyl/asparaginyl beta-hydroxylase domain-containing protein [Sphingomonadaceae bacterium]|nr:aspartyl/asparaginyl beta-hydroxylase domain-containing protein [Sphingomonadaceae bacterium]